MKFSRRHFLALSSAVLVPPLRPHAAGMSDGSGDRATLEASRTIPIEDIAWKDVGGYVAMAIGAATEHNNFQILKAKLDEANASLERIEYLLLEAVAILRNLPVIIDRRLDNFWQGHLKKLLDVRRLDLSDNLALVDKLPVTEARIKKRFIEIGDQARRETYELMSYGTPVFAGVGHGIATMLTAYNVAQMNIQLIVSAMSNFIKYLSSTYNDLFSLYRESAIASLKQRWIFNSLGKKALVGTSGEYSPTGWHNCSFAYYDFGDVNFDTWPPDNSRFSMQVTEKSDRHCGMDFGIPDAPFPELGPIQRTERSVRLFDDLKAGSLEELKVANLTRDQLNVCAAILRAAREWNT